MADRIEPYKRRGRCVHCGQPGVTPGEPCEYAKPTGHATMDLPDGKRCGDCFAVNHCAAFYGRIAADEVCDFFPVRFVELLPAREAV